MRAALAGALVVLAIAAAPVRGNGQQGKFLEVSGDAVGPYLEAYAMVTSNNAVSWERVRDLMSQAITAYGEGEGPSTDLYPGSRPINARPYYPYYYLGVAKFWLGDCQGARDAWASSLQFRGLERGLLANAEQLESACAQFLSAVSQADDAIAAATVAMTRLDDETRPLEKVASIWTQRVELGPAQEDAAGELAASRRLLDGARNEAGDGRDATSFIADRPDDVEAARQRAATRFIADRQDDAEAARQRAESVAAAIDRIEQAALAIVNEPPTGNLPVEGLDDPAGGGAGNNDVAGQRDDGRPPDGGESGDSGPNRGDLGGDNPQLAPPVTGGGEDDDRVGGGGGEPADDDTQPVAPDELRTAVGRYFEGDYDGVLTTLAAVDFDNELARWEAHMLGAAAHFTLWVSGGEADEQRLQLALAEVNACKRINPDRRPTDDFFSPRIIKLFDPSSPTEAEQTSP